MYTLPPRSAFSSSVGNGLFNSASLDLPFAKTKSLVDATTGSNLVDFTRQSSATYVGSDGLIKTAVTNLLLQSEDFLTTWSKSAGVSVTLDSSQGEPFSGAVVSRIDFTAGSQVLNQTRTYISGTHTASIWIKGVASETIQFAGETGTSVEVVTLTGDWQRLSQTFTAAASTQNFSINTFNSVTARTIYITAAQLEQSDTVGEYVKTTSTINSAPRFDHDPTTGESLGLLVEESRTNLLLQSEDFSTTWVNTLLTDNTNAITAPDGTVAADEIIETTATNIRSKAQTITSVASTTYTLSVFAKAGNGDQRYLRLSLNSAASTSLWAAASYDLSAGVVTSDNSAGGGTVTSTSIYPYPDGWFRCVLIGNIGANTDLNSIVTLTSSQSNYTPNGRGRTSYPGDGVSSIYIWGAQLEAGSFPTSYIPTTTAAVTRAADVAGIYDDNFGVFRTNLLQYSEEFGDGGWSSATGNRTVTSNQTIAPDGTLNADLVTADGTSNPHFISQSVTLSNIPYAFSVYAKAGTNDFLQLRSFSAFGGQAANFNLAAGSVGATAAGGTGSITAIGNGWYRCVLTFTPNAATSSIGIYLITGANSVGSETNSLSTSVYLWGAQLEQGSTATDYIKSDVNWTSRASNATYYDVNGTLKKSSYNLLLQSEDFSTTWSKSAGVSVTLDSSQGEPFSGAVVSRIDFTAGSQVLNQTRTYISGTHAASIWIKGVASETIQFAGETGTSVEVVTLTGDWQRLSQTFTATASTQNFSINTFNSVTARTIYITAAQLETGTTVGDYAKTTTTAASTARTAAYLPDGNGNFVSAGPLLLEAAGTNLLLRSEEFDESGSWSVLDGINAFGSGSVANTEAAPDGQISADLITEDTSTGFHRIGQAFNYNANTVYMFSLYAKAGARSKFYLQLSSGLFKVASFDLIAGTATGDGAIRPVGNGWYRCSLFSSNTVSGSATAYIEISDDSYQRQYTGDGTSGIYIWGAQLEQSSYPTSYIPTTTSTATRAADVSTSAATTVFESDWYRQEEGTVFTEFTSETSSPPANQAIVSIESAATNNGFRLYQQGTTGRPLGQWQTPAGLQANFPFTALAIEAGITSKIATAFADANFAGATSIQPGNIAVFNSGTVPTGLVGLGIGVRSSNSTFYANGTIGRLTYWPTRLPNDTLQTITQ